MSWFCQFYHQENILLCAESVIFFCEFNLAAQQPGWVTVLVFGEANEYLGSTQFLYEDEMEKLISQLAEDPAGWSKLVKLLSQHDVNVLQNTGKNQ